MSMSHTGNISGMDAKKVTTDLTVALLASFDPSNPTALSGMPYSMMQVLSSRGASVYPVSPESTFLRVFRRLPGKYRRPLKAIRSILSSNKKRSNSQKDPELEKQQILNTARKSSELASRLVLRKEPDVIFGCCISTELYAFELDIPIVYYTDATPEIINLTYPLFRQRSDGYKAACDELERVALSRVAFAVFASQNTLNSAIDTFGLDPERGFVFPMGANIGLKDIDAEHFEADPPTRDNLRLCIVAADPIRKRLDLAVDITELLKKRGWKVELNYVGPPYAKADASAVVNSAGQLMLANAGDRLKLAKLISGSHVMLLPSMGEAFGIAPCEAAQFGRPSVVSEAGGLKEVVQDGKTGYVLSLAAGPAEYADAIERIVSAPEAYREMSRVCQEHGLRELTWDHWGDQIIPLLERAVAQRGK
ncbi:MAG: glycosyltransferase family 4 protein [Planctomycetes bacterium]|nr:glycosyltransferase family 4 protein [Planctomycetota bacterium]